MCSALQNQLDACNGWEIDRTLEQAMDALRCPPPDALVANLSGGESGQQGTDEENPGLGGRILLMTLILLMMLRISVL